MADQLYSKTRMKLWPLDNELSDAVIERWARLNGRAAEVFRKVTMSRSDKTFYAADQQERPCFMINGSQRNIVFYNGSAPWTRAAVTVTNGYETVGGVYQPHEQTPFHVSEPWIGVQVGTVGSEMLVAALYCPDGYRMCYTHYAQNDTGTTDLENACTYLANSPMAIIDSDATYYWRHAYILGTVDQIRDYVYAQARQAKPDWSFTMANGRNDFHPWKSTDQKMPFPQDSWRVVMQDHESKLVSAMGSWAASGITNLKIQMAYTGSRSSLFALWLRSGQKPAGFNPDRPSQESLRWPNGTIAGPAYDAQSITFPVTGDGVERTYTVNVSSKSGWTGIIQQFEIGYYYGWAGSVNPGEIFNVKRIWCE